MKRILFLILIILVFTAAFSSCDPDPEGSLRSNCWIDNSTSDTLVLKTMWRNRPQNDTVILKLLPHDTTFFCAANAEYLGQGNTYNSYWEIFASYDQEELSPIEIYRHDTLVAKWTPPCRDMGDTNSWYNKNSWSSVHQGRHNLQVRSTFTITEADYGHFF